MNENELPDGPIEISPEEPTAAEVEAAFEDAPPAPETVKEAFEKAEPMALPTMEQIDWSAIKGSQITSLNDKVEAKVKLALGAYSMGEQVDYAMGTTVVPGQSGQPTPLLVLMLAIPSGILGQNIQVPLMIDNFFIDQDTIDRTVQGAIAGLLEARTKMGTDAMQNAPQSGLIVP